MEAISAVSQTTTPEEKRAPTTTALNSSPSSSPARGQSSKRQRLDSKKPATAMDSSADFISLDISSESEDEEPSKEEYINTKSISRTPVLDSTGDNTLATVDGSGTDEKDGEEEGGVEEKTSSKRWKGGTRKPKVSATEVTAGGVQPEPQNSKVEEDSSDQEDGGIKIAPTNGSGNFDGADSESEEDKDSSTQRALQIKETNSLQVPGEGNNKEPEAVEAAAVDPEIPSANLSNGAAPVAAENDAETMSAKDRKRERRKEKEKVRKRQKREERKASRKAARKALIDVPKGGAFDNLPDGKNDNEVNEAIELSSDDDDEGLEINVDMDIGDFEDKKEEQLQQAKNNVNSKEVESAGENAEEHSDDGGESSDDDYTAPVDQDTAIKQIKYYTAFTLPPFHVEESRPLFAPVGNPDFKSDMAQERKAMAPGGVAQSKRICSVCTVKGHSEDKCENLKCKHCGSWNKHFSHACPDAERDDEPRVKDKWRRIPAHHHKSIPPPSSLPVACYHCAGNDHFGDDCPRIQPLSVPGSFSLTDINTNTYATQEWLLELSDKLTDLESKGGESKAKYGIAGTKMTIKPAPDPFKDLRRFDDPPSTLPKRPLPVGPARNGGRDNDPYKSRGPRSNAGSYRPRSPVRDSVFERYREPRELLPQRPVGLPQRPRSRSPPPRYRSGGGGGGGGGHRYGPPADHYSRPSHSGSRGSGGGGSGYGGSRAYESRSQPPLPNEPPPRGRGGGREPYRPMPSSAKGNWQRYKT